MSGLLSGQVWSIELTHTQQTLMLCLADHAQDDGTKVFPSVARMMWKTGYSRRRVQTILQELVKIGLLIPVSPGRGGGGGRNGYATEYRIDLSKGLLKPPFKSSARAEPSAEDSVVESDIELGRNFRHNDKNLGCNKLDLGCKNEQARVLPVTPQTPIETSEETSNISIPVDVDNIQTVHDILAYIEGFVYVDKQADNFDRWQREHQIPSETVELKAWAMVASFTYKKGGGWDYHSGTGKRHYRNLYAVLRTWCMMTGGTNDQPKGNGKPQHNPIENRFETESRRLSERRRNRNAVS